MITRAKEYLEKYQSATTPEEREGALTNYQSFLQTLSAMERAETRRFMQANLRPQIQETIQRLDALTEQANLLLNQREKVSL